MISYKITTGILGAAIFFHHPASGPQGETAGKIRLDLVCHWNRGGGIGGVPGDPG